MTTSSQPSPTATRLSRTLEKLLEQDYPELKCDPFAHYENH